MKKMNQKTAIKFSVMILLTAVVFTFTHCVTETANETPKEGGSAQNLFTTEAGSKNEEQILNSMGSVTGINPFAVDSIMTVYRQVEQSLPTDSDIKNLSSTQQAAVTKLAAEFCFALSHDDAARSAIWPDMNFEADYDTFFSAPNKEVFIQNMMTTFWGPGQTNEELHGTYQQLNDLITTLKDNLQDPPQKTTTATLRAVQGACTFALSSAYVTLL
jgi:hypothetical protein